MRQIDSSSIYCHHAYSNGNLVIEVGTHVSETNTRIYDRNAYTITVTRDELPLLIDLLKQAKLDCDEIKQM